MRPNLQVVCNNLRGHDRLFSKCLLPSLIMKEIPRVLTPRIRE